MSGKPAFNRRTALAQQKIRVLCLFALASAVFIIGCTRGSKDFFANLLPIQSNEPVSEKFAQLSESYALTRSTRRPSQETNRTPTNRPKSVPKPAQLVTASASNDEPVGRISISDKDSTQVDAFGIVRISNEQDPSITEKAHKPALPHADELQLRAEGLYAQAQQALKAKKFEKARMLAHSADQLMRHGSLGQSPTRKVSQPNQQLAIAKKTAPQKTNVAHNNPGEIKISASNLPRNDHKTKILKPGFAQIQSRVAQLSLPKKQSQPTVNVNLESAKPGSTRVPRQSTPARFVGIVIPVEHKKKSAGLVSHAVGTNHPGPMQALSLKKSVTGANQPLKLQAGPVLMAPISIDEPNTPNSSYLSSVQHGHFESTTLQNRTALTSRESITSGISNWEKTNQGTLLPITDRLTSKEIQSLEKVDWKVQPTVSSKNKPAKQTSLYLILTVIAVVVVLLILASRRLRTTARARSL